MRRLLAFCTAALVAGSALAQEIRYSVLIMEKPAGTQVTLVKPDGSREISFEYHDRGRGPKVSTRMRLDAAGVPVSIETSGNDYLKSPVSERFSLTDAVASWKNNAENGERKLTGPAYFLGMYGAPEDEAVLAAALLKAPQMRLPLLPAGEARLRRTGETTLRNNGGSIRVLSYEIEGLNFTPSPIWLDENARFFASVSAWLSVVRESWESSATQLLEKQESVQQVRRRELQRSLARKATGALAITNARVFDSQSGRSTPGTTVVVEGNRIKSVGPDATAQIPGGAQRIDAQGRSLLPGLWDMHVHLGPDSGLMHIAAGVTGVRDLANENDSLLAIKRKIEAGEEVGPRIVMRGFMDGRGPYAGPTKVFVDTEQEARGAIESYAKLGYDGIKIYSSIKPELVPAIIRLAHGAGLRVSGHVPAFMTAQQFVEAGADEIQHINFLFLSFFFDQVKDTRTPARFTELADRAGTLDLSSEPVRAFVKLLKDRGVVVDPTVTIFHSMLTDRPGTVSANFAAIADRLPPHQRRGLLAGGLPVPEGKDSRYRESARALLRMIKVLYDAGVPIVPGTDALEGFTLHRELELYVEAGIPAPEVLRIATLNSARVAGREKDLGSITPGKLADMVLVEGDPSQNISHIRRTVWVMKDGARYDAAALYKSVGVTHSSQ